ncbi:MAG: hypothetical protein K0R73_771 [Candidatus Midichloriaceae bacterium]|nr:hypothetical protein [Candidatus Midichloriaceae bacterium]
MKRRYDNIRLHAEKHLEEALCAGVGNITEGECQELRERYVCYLRGENGRYSEFAGMRYSSFAYDLVDKYYIYNGNSLDLFDMCTKSYGIDYPSEDERQYR